MKSAASWRGDDTRSCKGWIGDERTKDKEWRNREWDGGGRWE